MEEKRIDFPSLVIYGKYSVYFQIYCQWLLAVIKIVPVLSSGIHLLAAASSNIHLLEVSGSNGMLNLYIQIKEGDRVLNEN